MATKKAPPTLPTSLRIFGVPHVIEWDAKDLPEDEFGNYLPAKTPSTIQVGDTKLASTLLHEISHGILFTSGLSGILGEKLEEAVAVAMENGLLPLIPLIHRIMKLHPPK